MSSHVTMGGGALTDIPVLIQTTSCVHLDPHQSYWSSYGQPDHCGNAACHC